MAMARHALTGSKTREMRATLSEALSSYVAALEAPEMVALASDDAALLIALSVLVARARSPVERDARTREIEFVPQGEGPARFARQLHKLTLALYTLRLGRRDVHRAIRRLALDSITPVRRQALELLLDTDEAKQTAKVATALGLPTGTARRVLEDLSAHGLLDRRKVGTSDTSPYKWWATELARDLWQLVENPHEQAESALPEMSQSPLSRERQSVEDDFSGKAFGPVDDGASAPLCGHSRQWLARDDTWRCSTCEPPLLANEVRDTRTVHVPPRVDDEGAPVA
jgi:predicted transcriptional regulator